MKHIPLLLSALLLLCSLPAGSQVGTDPISLIKKSCNKIDMDRSLTKQLLTLEGSEVPGKTNAEGIELTGYWKDNVLVKIKSYVSYDWGTIQIDCYFEKNQLIYAQEYERHYMKSAETGQYYGELSMAYNGNYYFANNFMIQGDHVGLQRNPDKKSAGPRVLQDATKFAEILKAKQAGN